MAETRPGPPNLGFLDWRVALIEVSFFLMVYAQLYRSLSNFLSKLFKERYRLAVHQSKDVACKGVSAMFAASAFIYGVYLLYNTSKTQKGDTHPLLKHVFYAASAYFVYDVFAMYDVFRSQWLESHKSSAVLPFLQDKWLIVIHHISIGVVFTPMIALKLDHDPGQLLVACALVMEGSTPFVSLRAVLSQMGLKSSFIYLVNGVAMIVVFLSCRILVYPAFFWAYSQQRSISFLETFNRIPIWPCKTVLLLVLALQSYWFVIMIRGAARIVAGKQEASAAVNGNGVISSNGKKAQ